MGLNVSIVWFCVACNVMEFWSVYLACCSEGGAYGAYMCVYMSVTLQNVKWCLLRSACISVSIDVDT